MTRRMLVMALMASCLTLDARAAPVSWSEAFRDEVAPAVTLTQSGALVRGPFSLAESETLWASRTGDHVVRFRVGPDGNTIAWLTRAGDLDTARVWISAHAAVQPRADFASFLPRDMGRPYFESSSPSTRDPTIRGGRLITPGPQHLRHASNSLEWMPDGSGVVFGYNEGLAHVSADQGPAWEISSVRIVELLVLDPAAIFLADLVAVTDGNRIEGWHLIYPTGGRWKVFPAGGLDGDARWTASPTTVWWTSAGGVRQVQAHDPTIQTIVEGRLTGNWLRYVPARQSVYWVSGRELLELPAGGSKPRRARAFSAEIKTVVETADGRAIGFSVRDSLYLWNPAADEMRGLAVEGEPLGIYENDGTVAVSSRVGSKIVVTRWAAGGNLPDSRSFATRNLLGYPTPSGDRILFVRRVWTPAEVLDVLDLTSGEWFQVSNPGIVAWEPLRSW